MLAMAGARCSAQANAAFAESDAGALAVEDASFDAALIVQVLEYVADVDAALAELHRALRPGGRVVVWDVDWSTVSWQSVDPERMQRVLRAWDRHLAHPTLPRTLGARLRGAGFADVRAEGHAFVATSLSTDTYVGALFPMLEQFVRDTGVLPDEEVTAWAAEQRELSDRGAFFFACTQCCFTATHTG